MRFYLTRRRRLDAVLDKSAHAADVAQQRAVEAGLDDHTIAIEANLAYHERLHELRTAGGFTYDEVVQRCNERNGIDPADEAEIAAWLDEQAAQREAEDEAEIGLSR